MKNTLEKFFKYLKDENFEEGAVYFASLTETPITIFCLNFLKAKYIVESSYSYTEARKLYKKAAEAVQSMDEYNDLFNTLVNFSEIQSAILRIDRGIYTGYAFEMDSAAQELKQQTESSLEFFKNENNYKTNDCYHILQENLVAKAREDNEYAKAIIIVADLYLNRWTKIDDFENKILLVQDAVNTLEKAGNKRLASDLAPHLHVLKRFENRRKKNGKLFIKNGEVVFYYYGTLDYGVREEFNDVLSRLKNNNKFYDNLGVTQIISEEMTDIWSGLASIDFIDTYKFKFQNIKIAQFRGLDYLQGNVELKYYTMGIFEIKITFLIDNSYLLKSPDGLSLSGMRHLQSLGTPFALDEKIIIEGTDEEYNYLAEYADTIFEKLDLVIVELLKKSTDTKTLTYNTEQNRFILTRVNQIVENFGDRIQKLHSQDFEKHFQFKALVMPIREVRSSIDNWIMYNSEGKENNVAGVRYNESEWLSINLYQGIVALLEQPVWVFDQAIESIEVALSISHLLQLSNIQVAAQLKHIDIQKDLNLKSNELKDLKVKLESEIDQLDGFKFHLTTLLETVEAGSMMTYHDHTIFMEKIFKKIELDKQKNKALDLQTKLRDKRVKSMEVITKINEDIVHSQQKRIKLIVSIISIFIVLGNSVDLFDIWSNSKMIQDLGIADESGDVKISLVLILALISIIWIIYDYFKDRKGQF